MNLYNEYNTEQIALLNKAGVSIVDKEYTKDEIKGIENVLANYIMNQSKNNIWKVRNQYDSILNKLNF